MCGVVGILSARPVDERLVRSMANSLEHRGPDAEGVWIDSDAGIGLGHRRLAVLELSPAGAQPMASHCGRYQLSFNGEIYNHLEIRRELESTGTIPWQGRSDTETLLAAFARWGVKATLARAVGMFVIALWDRQDRQLTLVRDRLGEKPLYYGWIGGDLVFGSEIHALRRHPGFEKRIDRDAVALYLRRNYLSPPYSIFRDIYKLQPGCMMTVNAGVLEHRPASAPFAPATGPGMKLERFWSLAEVAEAGRRNPFDDEEQAFETIQENLVDALRLQSVADVPVGAFLSGGVDSSTVVALMSQVVGSRVKTFTIGFEDQAMDESRFARAVADHLGTEHQELIIRPADVVDTISRLPQIYSEPFADSSQIPTAIVSNLARQSVTVSLSGDGGDELFGGYDRYAGAFGRWNRLSAIPAPLRHAAGGLLDAMPSGLANLALHGVRSQRRAAGNPAAKLAHLLKTCNSLEDVYFLYLDEWAAVKAIVPGAGGLDDRRAQPEDPGLSPGAFESMLYWDATSYLPADILCKVDRAAMSVGLETRVPMLDHRLVASAWRIPDRGATGRPSKNILRRILYQHVPPELIERPKAGFGIPVGKWLRHELRDWAEDLLSEQSLRDSDLLDPVPVRARWREHLAGRHDWSTSLWSVLMLQAWLRSID
ncbi:MAG: asparagine synthase (glutamine-hydrolyzing) [Brevundimonas sp.]|jgi:asparagine synthase (glutamine-hydrolysing)|uniref:asparagine synthase (glutamine-hydrolyzing) n=1 Tax=Brevundimonas sp. TaxID=1871086 RepID=UPI0039E46576